MNMRRWLISALAPFSLLFLLAVPAAADQFGGFSDLSPTDTTLYFSGTIGSITSSPVVASAGGNTLTFTDAHDTFEYDQVGTNYLYTSFANGTNLLYASGFKGSGAPVTITFANAITEFGFNAEEFNAGPYTISFTVYDGATDLGTFTSTGCDPTYAVSACTTSNGVLSFEGFQSLGGITSVTLSDTDSDADSDNIGLGPIAFGGTPTSTPEPGTLALSGVGLLGLLLVMRRRIFAIHQLTI
jgi:hypothetical protein